jgi:hypothetical protein
MGYAHTGVRIQLFISYMKLEIQSWLAPAKTWVALAKGLVDIAMTTGLGWVCLSELWVLGSSFLQSSTQSEVGPSMPKQ